MSTSEIDKIVEEIAKEFMPEHIRSLYFHNFDTYVSRLKQSEKVEVFNYMQRFPEVFDIDTQNNSVKLKDGAKQLLNKYNGFVGYKNRAATELNPLNERGFGFENTDTKTVFPKGQKHLFGIGIDEYKHLKRLNNAVKDINAIAEELFKRYDFDKEHLTILKNEDATRDTIINTLHNFTKKSVLGENDSLLIYFAGHGILDDNEEGYWVPFEAERDNISSFVPNQIVIGKIKNMKCRHVLLISDSCFSGSLLVANRDEPVYNLVATELEARKSRWVITSGGRDEKVQDGIGNSPFAKAILSELKNSDKTEVIADELAMRVRYITRANAPQMPQSGRLYGVDDAGGQFVFNLINKESADRQPGLNPDNTETLQPFLNKYPQRTNQPEGKERIAELKDTEKDLAPNKVVVKKPKDNPWLKWLISIVGSIYVIPLMIIIAIYGWEMSKPTSTIVQETPLPYSDSILIYQRDNNYPKLFQLLYKKKSVLSPSEMCILAEMYDYGRGVKQNYKTALQWYERAAENGVEDAVLRLGYMYYKGIGVTRNYKEALRRYEYLTDYITPFDPSGIISNNSMIAYYRIGSMYEYGQGVEKDLDQAARYYKIAANADPGLENAKERLKRLGYEPDVLGKY